MTERAPCTRFEDEYRDPYHNDPVFTKHVSQCKDCQIIQAQHRILAKAISRMHEHETPTPGWEDRVNAKIAELEAQGDHSSEDRDDPCPAPPPSQTRLRSRHPAD